MSYLGEAWVNVRRWLIVTTDRVLGRGGEIAQLVLMNDRLQREVEQLRDLEARYEVLDEETHDRKKHFQMWYRDTSANVERLQSIIQQQRQDIDWHKQHSEANITRLLEHMTRGAQNVEQSLYERLRNESTWNSDGASDTVGNPHVKALFGFAPADFTARSQGMYQRGLRLGTAQHPSPRDLYDLYVSQLGMYCAYSGLRLSLATAEADHIIPLAAGGQNCAENMVWIDGGLNSSKGRLFLDVWAQKNGLEREWLMRRINAIRGGANQS